MGKTCRKSAVEAAVIITILIAVALIGGCTSNQKGGGGESNSQKISAAVNGANITVDEVNEEYASLSPGQREQLTKADALSFIIEREILYQQAVKEGIVATKEEQEREYLSLLGPNATENEIARQLAAKNSSPDKMKSAVYKQILINKLLDLHVQKTFTMKHEEAEALYNASDFRSLNISFDDAERSIVDFLTAQKRKAQRESYITGLKDSAKVLIIGVPN